MFSLFKQLFGGGNPENSNTQRLSKRPNKQLRLEAAEMAKNNAQLQQKYDDASREQERMTKELGELREKIQNLEQMSQKRSSQLSAQQSESRKQGKQLTDSLETAKQVHKEKEKLTSELRQKSQRIASLEDELLKQQKDIERWKEHNKSFAEDAQKLTKELEEANKKTESVAAQLNTVQLEALKQVQSNWTAVEDSTVRDASDSLHAKIRAWAKKYSAPSLRESLGKFGPDLAAFLQHLRPLAGFSGWESLVDFKYPFLIVVTVVSEHLRVHVFSNPFHLLSFAGENGGFTDDGNHLKSIYDKLLERNEPGAHEFRTQLLRVFFPKSQFGQIGLEPLLIQPEVPQKVCQDITRTFCNWFAPLLGLDETSVQQCYDELLQIVSEAVTIGNHLATQQTRYIWQSAATQMGQNFAVSSPYLKADRLNRLDDDEDDKCDGKPIGIILGLALSAFGNNDGENYDKSRVLTKASVWVDDRVADHKASRKVGHRAYHGNGTQWR